jgi:hypothetical protein
MWGIVHPPSTLSHVLQASTKKKKLFGVVYIVVNKSGPSKEPWGTPDTNLPVNLRNRGCKFFVSVKSGAEKIYIILP